ncbi:MAG TPA: T9SS type B sorting domain-containing protein [Chitinophagaceae bacterium]|nr:T9SS type B sorting domain-containing protein [Chitinophagaceae bacterium]
MKKLLVIFFICSAIPSFARHITGGEIFYEYLGPGAAAGTSQYKITLRLFRDCFSSGAQLDPTVNIGIFDKLSGTPVSGSPFTVSLDHIQTIQKSGNIPCIINPPQVCYQVGFYYFTVTLPNNQMGYWISFQRCCRVDNITNLSVAIGVGATYVGSIAGSHTLGNMTSNHNSSPQFYLRDTALVCQNRNFTLDFSASDPDGDLLTYEFCEAYTGGSEGSPVVTNPPPPPYAPVPYGNGYSASAPMGPGVTINPTTGIISGIAPGAGSYVITVCINEWRNGNVINTHRKDFILKVADCDFVAAQLPLSAVFCDDFNVGFANQTPTSLIYSWHWDFGIAGTLNDTANIETPSFTYPDTGLYTVKLVVNPGDPCSDSATMQIGLYPGFFPDFVSSGICVTKPTSFTDATTTAYGVVSGWRWDFGEPTVNNDTSRLRNPVYSYPTVGVKDARLIVQSNKGCIDTVTKAITIIDKPPITLPFRDTLICYIDTLQLSATGSGVFSWTPNYNILLANTANPLVYPKTTTWYKVLLDDNGCVNTDSIRVRVVDHVTLVTRTDTTFCKGDGVQLGAITNGLQFSWTPTSDLDNPNILNPIANPPLATTYQLTARIGGCSATDDVRVFVTPYPAVNAGPDVSICYSSSVQLNGIVRASSFYWRPQGSLNNPNILNPIAYPALTTKYILTATDTLGCPKPGYDTVTVTVRPKVQASAGRDTMIVFGQPLQLHASGGENYLWTPSSYLNNINISNPIAKITETIDSIRYKVYVTDQLGCLDSATVLVKIFRTNPQIFVPTGFTPNGDGRNDVLKPIAVGIQRIEYFRVYNRWGQLVFSTTVNGQGWNGEISGKPQTTNTYAWIVKAIDYTGKPIFQKGTSTLIR